MEPPSRIQERQPQGSIGLFVLQFGILKDHKQIPYRIQQPVDKCHRLLEPLIRFLVLQM
jgi:hypothetical protein